MISSLSDRAHYTSLNECIYFNQASLGLIGQPAVSAMSEFLESTGRHGNLNMSDDDEVAFFSELRKEAAILFNCDGKNLGIVASAGEMLSQLPYLFAPAKGSKILSVATDFPAITRPWLAYCEKNDCQLEFVEDQQDKNLTRSLLERIDESTSVVAISYVQFSTGSLVDVYSIRKASEKVGARLLIDVTQAAGAIPIHAGLWNAEVVVCSGYKWLGGHGGVGLAVISPEFLDQLPPAPGWMGAPDPFDFKATQLPLANDARRYTQSTMSYISMKGLTVAIRELIKLEPAKIETHARSLSNLLIERLKKTEWQSFGDAGISVAPHIVSLANANKEVQPTVQSLYGQKIICGGRNNRIRISLAHFNDEEDLNLLVDVLTSA